MITGFCITHNSVEKGEPFVEAILQVKPFVDEILVVDMESTDNTRDILYQLDVRILVSTPNEKAAFLLHEQAAFQNIIFFEAHEIYARNLLKEIRELLIDCNIRDISVLRLVLEQNFQRIRWYPEFTHRVFRRNTAVKMGHTTNKEHLKRMIKVGGAKGYLWSCQNCFLDNIISQHQNGIRLVPSHFIKDNHVDINEIAKYNHWRYDNTPICLPKILLPHVGRKKYNPYLSIKGVGI